MIISITIQVLETCKSSYTVVNKVKVLLNLTLEREERLHELTCGAKEETKDWHNPHITVRRGEREAENYECNSSVLYCRLQGYCNYLNIFFINCMKRHLQILNYDINHNLLHGLCLRIVK